MYRIYELPRREPNRRTLQADTETWARLADDMLVADRSQSKLVKLIKRDIEANGAGIMRLAFDDNLASVILNFAKLSA